MSDVAPVVEAPTAEVAAPAAPAAPAPSDTLFSSAPAPEAPPTEAPAADPIAWLPEKFRVMNEGKLDVEASSKKLAESYTNLEKVRTQAPAKPDEYQFTPPEQFKDLQLDPEGQKAFRERAHKAGLSQSQFEFVMGEYFELVPSVLNAAAKMSADEARSELQKVWQSPAELQANMGAAERAVSMMPADLQEQIRQKYGTDPVFWQFAAQFGKETREDRPPSAGGGGAPPVTDVEAVMRSEAYRNPKHPDHARVSQQVQEFFNKRHGNQPVF